MGKIKDLHSGMWRFILALPYKSQLYCMCGCNKKTWCMGTEHWVIAIAQHWETQSCSDSCVMGCDPAPVNRWNGGNTEEISSLRLGSCWKSEWYINRRSILPVGGLWGSTVLTHPFTCFITSWLFDSIYNILFSNLLSEWHFLNRCFRLVCI